MKDKQINNFIKSIPAFLKKGTWILFFVILGVLASKFLVTAQQDIPIEEKIYQKLESVLGTQTKIQEQLNKILGNQEEIKKELGVIKIRATVR